MTGRAYPLSSIALLILDKAERYSVQLARRKKATARWRSSFLRAGRHAVDERGEAVAHVLKTSILPRSTRLKRTATEPRRAFIRSWRNAAMSGSSWPAEPSRLPEPVRKLHHGEVFADAFRHVQSARQGSVKDEA